MKDTITLPRSVVEQTLAAMQSFVSKCDTGLARSKNSYWDFKAVLPDLQAAFDAPVEAPTPQNLELHIAQLKATSIILRNSNEPVTFSAKKIAIADAIDALLLAVAAPTAEPQRGPLTEEQIFDLAGNYDCGTREENERWIFTSPAQLLTFVRAFEAVHGIKEGS